MPIFSGLDFGTFAFNYEPLLYPDSIRLLQLVPPDSPGRPLIQDILIAKLSEAPRFVAVSYCWGTAEQTIPIQCGQRILLVTPNLASALLAIRPAAREAPELFWIDQLCINQRNLSERAHQVKIMGHIYQQAAKTVVWLGKEEPYFPLLQELVENTTSTLHDSIEGKDFESIWAELPEPLTTESHEHHNLPPLDSPVWKCLANVLQRPWFRRVWVIQEVVNSSDVMVKVGHFELSWPKFVQHMLWLHLKGYDELLAAQFSLTNPALAMFQIEILQKLPRNISGLRSIIQLARKTRNFDATDPRDKIYALHGLASEFQFLEPNALSHHAVDPDYSKSVEEVYCDLARFVIAGSHQLEPLAAVDHAPPEHLLHPGRKKVCSNLPSWVPDWDANAWCGVDFPNTRIFEASGKCRARLKPSHCDRTLIVEGTIIDTVEFCMDPFEETDLTLRGEDLALSPYLWIYSKIIHRLKSYPTGEDLVSAFIVTTMAGEHPGGRPVSDVPRADFLAYMNAAFKMHFCFNLPNRTALKKLSRIERLRRLVDAYNMSRKKKGSEARAEFEAFMSYTEILDALSENGKAEVYVTSLRSCLRRCFFLTSQHYMGIGPAMIRPGDVVCVLFGGNAPFILRQNGQFYELVGPAYFHGFMKGEAIEAVESGRLSRTWFHLQ